MLKQSLRIVSDGTGAGTRIENAETGEEILVEGLAGIAWFINAADPIATVVLRLHMPAVNVQVPADRVVATTDENYSISA